MSEFHLSQDSDNRSKWYAASDDSVWTERLKRVGATLVRVRGDTHFFELNDNQVVVRKAPAKRAPLTDEQKAKLAAQLARGRATQSKGKFE